MSVSDTISELTGDSPVIRRLAYTPSKESLQKHVSLPRKAVEGFDVDREHKLRLKRLKDPKYRCLQAFPYVGVFLGITLSVLYTLWRVFTMPNYKYCLVLEDNFDEFNLDTWSHEISLGGFGNGQFEYTTNSSKNTYVKDGSLYIVPTFTQDEFTREQMYNNYTLNLTSLGCESDLMWKDCWITSNSTNHTILPPVQSARITTRNSVSLKYGKIEIRAKTPIGKWIWPAMWMFPKDSVYGAWPASGEIDILESRGNDRTYEEGGNNMFQSTLHWGLIPEFDRYRDTYAKYLRQHGTLNDEFHTYGLEWTPEYILTWIDSPLKYNMYVPFDKPFFLRGNFDLAFPNGTTSKNPGWSVDPGSHAPFDQEFFLILNVAVGGTNGYFIDGLSKKPWIDSSPTAPYDFWENRDTWQDSWSKEDDKRGMVVDSVKMWKMC